MSASSAPSPKCRSFGCCRDSFRIKVVRLAKITRKTSAHKTLRLVSKPSSVTNVPPIRLTSRVLTRQLRVNTITNDDDVQVIKLRQLADGCWELPPKFVLADCTWKRGEQTRRPNQSINAQVLEQCQSAELCHQRTRDVVVGYIPDI